MEVGKYPDGLYSVSSDESKDFCVAKLSGDKVTMIGYHTDGGIFIKHRGMIPANVSDVPDTHVFKPFSFERGE